MAYIKKRLENLKPGKEYLLTVRSKNADLNVTSDYAGSIRFKVPQDSTIPGAIQNLALYASFEKVMFVFDFSEDIDIDQYEYELYDGNNVETATLVSSGFNAANVFTVSVINSSSTPNYTGPTTTFDINALSYWGRVRAIDTTGNIGEWTTLVQTDSETPLIGEQFIDSLTASKITAGTIGAHTIQLNGANSIIRSSTFDGTESSTPGYYDNFTTGWLINGNGNSYFVNTNIIGYITGGTIDIGANDLDPDTSFHVNSDGDMWLGSQTLNSAPFRVNSDGSVEIGQSTASGEVSTSLFIETDGSIHIGTSVATSPFSILSSGEVNIGTSPNLFKISTDGSVQIGKTSVSKTINAVASGTPSSGYVRYTTSANHGFSLGDSVTISGLAPSGYNGSYIITSIVSSTQFAVANTTTATVTDANGTVQTNSLFIDNEGAINIGPSLSSSLSEFIVQANGQVDIGGNSSSSFHVANDGTVWSGSATLNTSTTPFVLNPDGSIDIGGSDTTSVHIYNNGDISAGSKKGKRQTSSRSISTITGLTAATITVTTSTDHELEAGQKVTLSGLTTTYANQLNVIDTEVTEVTSSTVFKIANPIYLTVTGVSAGTPSANYVRYTTSTNHNFRVGQQVTVSGITPSGYSGTFTIYAINGSKTFDVYNTTTGTATLGTAVARVTTVGYTAGTGSVFRNAPFYVVSSTGLARVSSIDASGEIFGTSNHLNLTGVLRINDTVAIGSNTLRGTSSYSSYDEGINFSLSAANGFIGRLDTTTLVQIGLSGIVMGSSGVPLPITAYDYMRVANNGSAAEPSYRFNTTNDGFYTNGTDPYWSNGGNGYVLYSTRNISGEVWHSGNDGSGSGLDADKLDGIDSSGFVQTSGSQTIGGSKSFNGIVSFDGSVDKDVNLAYTGAYVRWSGTNGGYMGYSSSSSIRYKTDIENISLEELNPNNLLKIPVKQFIYKDGYLGVGDQKIGWTLPGFMAEDVNKYYPAAGTLDADGDPESWDPFFIIPPMLKLIQDLYKKIEYLESKI